MTMIAYPVGGQAGTSPAGPLLGPWVETHQEPCRGGRTYRLLVNHRTGQAMELTSAEAAICDGQAAGGLPHDAAAFLGQLAEGGFLAASPPAPSRQDRLTVSLSRLDLCWHGAGRLVPGRLRARRPAPVPPRRPRRADPPRAGRPGRAGRGARCPISGSSSGSTRPRSRSCSG